MVSKVSQRQRKIADQASPHLDHLYRRLLELLHRQVQEDEVPPANHIAESLDGVRRAELVARIVKQREGVAYVEARVDASKLEWRRLDTVVLAGLVGILPAELQVGKGSSFSERVSPKDACKLTG